MQMFSYFQRALAIIFKWMHLCFFQPRTPDVTLMNTGQTTDVSPVIILFTTHS